MKLNKKRNGKAIAAAVLLGSVMAGAAAQGPGGGPGGGPPPNFAAFQKFRDQHKYTFQLQTMMTRGVVELERQKSTQLKPAQAQKIMAMMASLQKQPKMTQDQAKAGIKSLQRILDQKQLAAIDRTLKERPGGGPGMRPGGGPPGGGPGMRPGGGGPPGGGQGMRPGGGPSGNRPRFDPASMKNFNPFRLDPKSPMYQMSKDRSQRMTAFLKARSAGKTAKLDMPGPPRFGGPPRGGGPRPPAPGGGGRN